MKIMIGGGFDEEATDPVVIEKMQAFVRVLAAQAIIQKHHVLSGNLSPMDAAIVDAACDAAEGEGKIASDWVVSYVPGDQDCANNRGEIRDSSNDDWDKRSGPPRPIPEPIEQADVLILIGGYDGTHTAAAWARDADTPVVPIATFGMASKEILNYEEAVPAHRRIVRLSDDDRQRLKKQRASLDGDDKIQAFAETVIAIAELTALSRDVFVAMSFSDHPQLDDYLDAVKMVCKAKGFEAERVDQRPRGETYDIIEKIHEEIQNCGLVIADLTGERPNVYYEIGYARGLGKPILLTNLEGSTVHFDIAGNARHEWSSHLSLREKLEPDLAERAKMYGIPEE